MPKKLPDVTWRCLQASVWHLVEVSPVLEDDSWSKPICGSRERRAVAQRRDGDYCRYCIGMEGGIV